MKRILLLTLTLIVTFSLSACGLFRDNEEEAAERVIEEWDGSLQFLSDAMTEMNLEEQFELRHSLELDVEENGVRNQLYVDAIIRGIKQNGLYTTEYLFEIRLPDTMPLEVDTFTLNMIIQEQGEAFDFYINIDTIRDIATAEEIDEFFDVLDMFAINESWVRFTFADNMQNIVELEMLEMLLEKMNMEFVLDYILDEFGLNLDYELGEFFNESQKYFNDAEALLQKYFNLDYIGNHDDVEIELEKTEDNHIQAVVKVDHIMLASILEAFAYDAYDFLVEMGAMPADMDPLKDVDLEEELSDMPAPIFVHIEYDPYTLDFMKITIDFLDLVEDADPNTTFMAFNYEVEVKNTTTINVPSAYGDLNHVAEEAAKLALMMDIMMMMTTNRYLMHEEGTFTLEDYSPSHNALFHPTMSEITVTSTTVIVDLYYIDEVAVFTEPLNLTAMEANAPEELMSREWIEYVIAPLNDATFSLTRFFAWSAGELGMDMIKDDLMD